jgi:hypothetical protein
MKVFQSLQPAARSCGASSGTSASGTSGTGASKSSGTGASGTTGGTVGTETD